MVFSLATRRKSRKVWPLGSVLTVPSSKSVSMATGSNPLTSALTSPSTMLPAWPWVAGPPVWAWAAGGSWPGSQRRRVAAPLASPTRPALRRSERRESARFTMATLSFIYRRWSFRLDTRELGLSGDRLNTHAAAQAQPEVVNGLADAHAQWPIKGCDRGDFQLGAGDEPEVGQVA